MVDSIVFDTNVLISAALLPRSASAQALVRAVGLFELCFSASTWTELQQVIARPKFARYLSDQAQHQFLQRVISVSRFVTTQSVVKDCSDAIDNQFLELALDVQARFVVSGDQHLLTLHPWRGIAICRPAEFLRLSA
ncbi:MAG: putative toxin-antitoxin system toxin component, PIN family [Rhodoferax sp.]|nr:putative toxin-antitoxin system toxin component, PIN family [Rhodoferax sp.]